MSDEQAEHAEEQDEAFIEQCLVCDAVGRAGHDGTFYGGEGARCIFVHAACLDQWRQRILTNQSTTPMNQPFKRNQHPGAPRRAEGNEQPEPDQRAGIVARGLIKHAGLEDTTEIWRALKRAYLTGYGDASR